MPGSFSVLTRDNILQLLPPDDEEAQCLAEGCAVEIGRAIGAEFATQGYIGKFGEMLTITVELYETMSGNMLSSFVTEGRNQMDLLNALRERAPGLFGRVPGLPSGAKPSEELKVESEELKIQTESINSEPNSQLSTLNSQLKEKEKEPAKKSKTPFFIALSLDVLGATALGVGIYQNSQKNTHYKKHKDLSNGVLPAAEKSKADGEYKKAEDARKSRDAAIIIGSALMASGIAVHIWF